jgi:hypothetical protein
MFEPSGAINPALPSLSNAAVTVSNVTGMSGCAACGAGKPGSAAATGIPGSAAATGIPGSASGFGNETGAPPVIELGSVIVGGSAFTFVSQAASASLLTPRFARQVPSAFCALLALWYSAFQGMPFLSTAGALAFTGPSSSSVVAVVVPTDWSLTARFETPLPRCAGEAREEIRLFVVRNAHYHRYLNVGHNLQKLR